MKAALVLGQHYVLAHSAGQVLRYNTFHELCELLVLGVHHNFGRNIAFDIIERLVATVLLLLVQVESNCMEN